ncbi:MAG: hypothetical protein ACLTEX_03660 [Eggerthella lenta]
MRSSRAGGGRAGLPAQAARIATSAGLRAARLGNMRELQAPPGASCLARLSWTTCTTGAILSPQARLRGGALVSSRLTFALW